MNRHRSGGSVASAPASFGVTQGRDARAEPPRRTNLESLLSRSQSLVLQQAAPLEASSQPQHPSRDPLPFAWFSKPAEAPGSPNVTPAAVKTEYRSNFSDLSSNTEALKKAETLYDFKDKFDHWLASIGGDPRRTMTASQLRARYGDSEYSQHYRAWTTKEMADARGSSWFIEEQKRRAKEARELSRKHIAKAAAEAASRKESSLAETLPAAPPSNKPQSPAVKPNAAKEQSSRPSTAGQKPSRSLRTSKTLSELLKNSDNATADSKNKGIQARTAPPPAPITSLNSANATSPQEQPTIAARAASSGSKVDVKSPANALAWTDVLFEDATKHCPASAAVSSKSKASIPSLVPEIKAMLLEAAAKEAKENSSIPMTGRSNRSASSRAPSVDSIAAEAPAVAHQPNSARSERTASNPPRPMSSSSRASVKSSPVCTRSPSLSSAGKLPPRPSSSASYASKASKSTAATSVAASSSVGTRSEASLRQMLANARGKPNISVVSSQAPSQKDVRTAAYLPRPASVSSIGRLGSNASPSR